MARVPLSRLCLLVLGLLLVLPSTGALAKEGDRGPGRSGKSHRRVCTKERPGRAACHAEVVTSSDAPGAAPLAQQGPFGYGPADLQSAYRLPSQSRGAGQTIAIVDAYDDPNAESDLAVYRSQYGLPPCTTANGCFRKVNQTGGTSYPSPNVGWAQEISLDLDMASAVCPNCRILLVEAKSNSFSDLGVAVDYAAANASAVSNSYGGSEFSSETGSSYEGHYNHPGIPITVSSGDDGYGVQFPAASRYVTAVGGTSLNRATSTRGWSETTWSGAGSGCSRYVSKPSWQADTGCARRTVADVSAVADPSTGVAVYDTYGSGGWLVFGGTSVSAPIVAGAYALIGAEAGAASGGSYFYSRRGSLFDVTTGTNGTCSVAYLCNAGPGFDGPTGLGTPNLAGDSTPPPPPPPAPVPAPTAVTGTATSVGQDAATLNATVDPRGQATTYRFEYGTDTAYGRSAPAPDADAGSGSGARAVAVLAGALSPATTYHFRVVATSAGGTSSGADASFTTAAAPAPRTTVVRPSRVTIYSGSIRSGSASSLAADDDSFLSIASTTSATRISDWYASSTGVPNSLSSLRIGYRGRNSADCSQSVQVYDYSRSAWTVLDARDAGATEVALDLPVTGAAASYVSGTSGTGTVAVRVRCTTSTAAFTASADQISVTYGS